MLAEIACVVGFASLAAEPSAQPARPAVVAPDDRSPAREVSGTESPTVLFTKPIVRVTTRLGGTSGLHNISLLARPSVRRLGDREFLVGEVAKPKSQADAARGPTSSGGLPDIEWIPVSEITHLMELDYVGETPAATTANRLKVE